MNRVNSKYLTKDKDIKEVSAGTVTKKLELEV